MEKATEEHAYVVHYCPECLGQIEGRNQWHRGDCVNRGKIFAMCQVLAVAVGDVAQWLDENYGAPDMDRFLRDFAPWELAQRGCNCSDPGLYFDRACPVHGKDSQ